MTDVPPAGHEHQPDPDKPPIGAGGWAWCLVCDMAYDPRVGADVPTARAGVV